MDTDTYTAYTTVRLSGSGRSIHWGNEFGTRCGAAHRVGRFTRPTLVQAEAVTCKRCAKLMASDVTLAEQLAHAENNERIQAQSEERIAYRIANDLQPLAPVEMDLNEAHAEALEFAEVIAFEQAMHDTLVSERWSHQDALEMTESCRDLDTRWSEPTEATRRYDELLRRHGSAVPFVVKEKAGA